MDFVHINGMQITSMHQNWDNVTVGYSTEADYHLGAWPALYGCCLASTAAHMTTKYYKKIVTFSHFQIACFVISNLKILTLLSYNANIHIWEGETSEFWGKKHYKHSAD